MIDFYILITAILVSTLCAVVGCFLVLRKMSMVGDAISHAVLPGIALAYMISGQRAGFPVLLGTSLAGLFVSFLIEWFNKKARLQSDAAIGLSFTLLFAIGLILVTSLRNVDLDQDCVLYGELVYIPLDLVTFGKFVIPHQTIGIGITLLLTILILWIGRRVFVTITFDQNYAVALGINTIFWHYLFMGIVSLTTVTCFESVGAILVVAFLVGPAATAWLVSHKMSQMILFAVVSGLISSVAGYYTAKLFNVSIAGCMSAFIGLQFATILTLK
ncbi:MAG: metal ABC transporter permease, partial [Bacteroidia bacterium]